VTDVQTGKNHHSNESSSFMTTDPFALSLPALAMDLQVTTVAGEEAMSAPYRFDIGVLVDGDDGFARRALGAAALLTMQFDGAVVRTVHGIVSACQITGRTESGAAISTLRLVPRMSLLKKRRTSRIFQDLTTRQIVDQVLTFSRVASRWQIARELPIRAYCVQYDETDYAFVTRLCASEGIFFTFDHPIDASAAGEVLVLADSANAYASIDGQPDLRFRPTGADGSAMRIEEDHLQAFGLRHATRTKRVLLRRFDFEKPPIPRLDSADIGRSAPLSDLESMRAFVDGGSTTYEHQHTREEALLDPIPAQLALEAETADAALAEAETACRRVQPGRRFRMVEHSLPELDGEYVAISCSHECHSPRFAKGGEPVYRNRITAVPAAVPFRPKRPRQMVRQTLETAAVVGPPGQEIHTDEYGRIKVQFHWDLQGTFTDQSSCWLRVAQPWAGSGYGVQFLPRVGSEVLVGYVHGDADRPVVLGSLHNGLNSTPFSFPRDLTRSGIKTSTSPGGGGGHELMFEDRAGAELVALRSNRTMKITAAEDASLGADRDLRVTAGGNRTDEVLGDVAVTVNGAENRTTDGARHTVVGGNDALNVKGQRDELIGGDELHRVGGVSFHLLGGPRSTIVGTDSHEAADDFLTVSGEYRAASARAMSFTSKEQIRLVCGDSKLTLFPDHILIESPHIQLQAKERIALVQGDPPEATLVLAGSASLGGGTVTVAAGGKDAGKLFLDAEAHLDGALVKLNCGAGGGAGAKVLHETEEKGKVRFAVLREGLPPEIMSVTLVIATPSGEVVERTCPVGGIVEMEGKRGDVFTVVETRVGHKSVSMHKKANAPEDG
jgi:type VI secretion system secreted protein VgrG